MAELHLNCQLLVTQISNIKSTVATAQPDVKVSACTGIDQRGLDLQAARAQDIVQQRGLLCWTADLKVPVAGESYEDNR